MSSLAAWSAAHLPDLSGRIAIVTGANSGIGYETARGLMLRGAHVVLACRNEERGAEALGTLRRAAPAGTADVRVLDLASLASVRAFAAAYDLGRLDVLVNNAGVMALPRRETADGFEMQFGTNVLGHYALTSLLLPHLLATPHSRTVWLSSLAHRFGRLAFDDLQGEQTYSPWGAYGQSKLADLMLALELDRRLHSARTDVISVAAHPGYTATNLQTAAADMKGSAAEKVFNQALNRAVAMPTWKGALPTLLAAAGRGVRGGDYTGPTGWGEVWGEPGPARISSRARDAAAASRLVGVCETLTGVALDPSPVRP
ncbi:MAG TPA: oxidoreductase [Rubricoccaceae bacterium]|jgi:NAD(P)-dependent dehydrogenase (short-subunit alcohol dehydrogenase family)